MIIKINPANNTDVYFTKTKTVELNEENFLIGSYYMFKLNYEKKSDHNETLYIFYEKEFQKNIEIIGVKKDFNVYDYEVYKTVGTITATIDKSAVYYIFIGFIKGNFKIISSEYEFEIDANKEIFIPCFTGKYPTQIQYSIANLDKNYMKLFSQINNLENTVLYSKNNSNFVGLKNILFSFEKGDSVKFRIILKNIVKKDIHISNIDENNISDLIIKNYMLDNHLNKIFKINYFKTPNFSIRGNAENKYYLSYISENQYNNLPNGIKDLSYEENVGNNYRKTDQFYYALLIIEIINNNSSLILNEIERPIYNLNLNEEINFDFFKSNYQLQLSYNKNEIFILLYKINKNEEVIDFLIKGPNYSCYVNNLDENEKNGIYFFGDAKKGVYNISFNSDKYFEGTFKLIDTSYNFEIDINENIKLDSFYSQFEPSPIILTFTIDNPKYVIYKKFFIGENYQYLNLVQIYDNNLKIYQNLNLNLYAFQGGKDYKIKIDYHYENYKYKMEQFIIENFTDYTNLEDFEFGLKKFVYSENITFIKVDFRITPKIEVLIKKNNPIIKISYYNDEVDIIEIINNFKFYVLEKY